MKLKMYSELWEKALNKNSKSNYKDSINILQESMYSNDPFKQLEFYMKNEKYVNNNLKAQIRPIYELIRFYLNNYDNRDLFIFSPDDFYDFISSSFDEYREMVWVVYLNTKQKIIKKSLISIGSNNFSYVSSRDIIVDGLRCSANSFLLAHNHPSGDETPSESDKKFTKKLKEVSNLCGLYLLDHLIVGNRYYSFRENARI